MRKSGILLHISSLPSPYGIGTLGKSAYEFIDFIKTSGFSMWQMLPTVPTGFGDSPYQSVSAFAGNPYFIDPEMLFEMGLLTKDELIFARPLNDDGYVDYGFLYQTRPKLLKLSCERLDISNDKDFSRFVEENRSWLLDYAAYMAFCEHFSSLPWYMWEDRKAALHDEIIEDRLSDALKSSILMYKKQQYLYDIQWRALHAYAKKRGITIIGDMPIYTSLDSADVWANRAEFMLDEKGKPKGVAGVPPDYFSSTGQLWGNPLYDYEHMSKNGFGWWKYRMKHALSRFDMVRIDHFRAFASYYCVPFGAKTAAEGIWLPGPGKAFFDAVFEEDCDGDSIIAETLGIIDESVNKLCKDCGFYDMAVLEFAFDSDAKNLHLPHNCTKRRVMYTGTHDNDTAEGFYLSASERAISYMKRYLDTSEKSFSRAFIKAAMLSVCDIAIIPMQDVLGLKSNARMNIPGTSSGNWRWRLSPSYRDNKEAMAAMLKLNEISGRTGDDAEPFL